MRITRGTRFYRLRVIEYSHSVQNNKYYRCLCDCGEEVVVGRPALVQGATKSCGCLRNARSVRAAEARSRKEQARVERELSQEKARDNEMKRKVREKAARNRKREKARDLEDRRKVWRKALREQKRAKEEQRVWERRNTPLKQKAALKLLFIRLEKRSAETIADWTMKDFIAWSMEHYFEYGAELIRKDPSRPYSPGNCQWVVWDDRKF